MWQGDHLLGISANAIPLARGGGPVELRLKKSGFGDALVSITPDHDQAREVNLTSLPATKSSGAASGPSTKAGSGGGKMDRILGGRD